MLMLGIICLGAAIAVSAVGVLGGRRALAANRGAVAFLGQDGAPPVAGPTVWRDVVTAVGGTRVVATGAGVLWGVLIMSARPVLGLMVAIVGGAAGWLGPAMLLERRARARAELIRRALPDALDLLAISVEAGVSLEGAMARAAEELGGPLGDELRRVLRELQLGSSRREALQALRDRVDVRELSTFVLGLLQADALGISIAALVRTQATEMRNLRRRLAREQAARAPVKILLPLVFFIFPALLVVVLGPAAIRIAATFSG